ncbi:MAG: hypothetical protein IT426_07840 [Pirellulales bacterium]|nr:hypothetical protein [Pirellulales bacterium]
MTAKRQGTCPKCHHTATTTDGDVNSTTTCPHCGVPLVAGGILVNETTGREVYNIVSDIGTGVNVRKKDNLYQLAAIGLGLLLGIVIGAFCMRDRVTGAVLGGFIGLLAGLFGSGIFLMIYRFIRHVQGRHK